MDYSQPKKQLFLEQNRLLRIAGLLNAFSSDCRERDFILLRKLRASFLFQQKRPAGFEREHGYAGRRARLQRPQSDARDVEPHVVTHLGDLDGDRAAVPARQFAAAREAFVRAFKSLDGENCSIFHDGNLADFQL